MKSVLELYKKIAYIANRIAHLFCILFFFLLVIDVVTSVVMRYLIVKPMVWGEQFAVYCMIWIAFLSASIAFRRGGHMGLDLLVERVPPMISKVIKLFAHMLIVLFLLTLIYWGAKHAYAVRMQKSPVVFNISMLWPYLSIPVGGVFMLIQEIGVILIGNESDD